jgi:hypothetical protein
MVDAFEVQEPHCQTITEPSCGGWMCCWTRRWSFMPTGPGLSICDGRFFEGEYESRFSQ